MRNSRIRLFALLALTLALLTAFGGVAQAAALPDVVSKAAIRSLTMNRRTLSMDLNRFYDLKVTVSPSKANWQDITWESSQPGVLSVMQNPTDARKARITVIAPDYPADPKVTVWARSLNGKQAACVVTIKPVAVTKVDVTPAKKTVYLTSPRPDPFSFKANISPSVAGEQGVTWESLTPEVATVDKDTGAVTVRDVGTSRIYATSKDGSGKRDYALLTVLPLRVKSFSLSVASQYMDIGGETTITPKILPTNASYQTITWKSSDESVATVDEGGKVTALKSGVATISAATDIGKYVKRASIVFYVRSANPTRVAITALGDVILGGDPRTYPGAEPARATLGRYKQLLADNAQKMEELGYNKYSFPFQYIRDIFGDLGGVTNLGFMNLECAITSKGGGNTRTTRTYLFKGEPAYIQGVVGLIDAVCVANNHANDFGGYKNTLTNIKTYGGGAKATGIGLNADFTVGDGNKKVTFVSVTSNSVNAGTLARRVQQAKKNGAALVVVSVHWTNMTQNKRGVSGYMQSYARTAIRAGADLVLGHHRHIVSGIEKYRGKYIVYDLGNAVAGGGSQKELYAFQIVMEMHEGFNEVGSDGEDVRIYPMWSTSSVQPKNNSDWQPIPLDVGSDLSNQVLSVINKYSPKGEDGKKFDAAPFLVNYGKK